MPNTIAQNLQRLQTARTNISSAITNKGVTVPSGSGFEDFANLIGSISAGESLIEGNVSKASSSLMLDKAYAYRLGRLVTIFIVVSPGEGMTVRDTLGALSVSGLNLPSSKPSGTVEYHCASYLKESNNHSSITSAYYDWSTGKLTSDSSYVVAQDSWVHISIIYVLPQ